MTEIINIPQGDTSEEIAIRRNIIANFYREWKEQNPLRFNHWDMHTRITFIPVHIGGSPARCNPDRSQESVHSYSKEERQSEGVREDDSNALWLPGNWKCQDDCGSQAPHSRKSPVLHHRNGGIEKQRRDGHKDHPSRLAPGIRGGCLPFGEARGGGFALSEIPHPYRGLFPDAKIRNFSIFQYKQHEKSININK